MMQLIKVWIKITTFLAIIGWITHALNPDFAAWVDGLFEGKKIVEQQAIRKPETVETLPAPPKPTAPVYKFND